MKIAELIRDITGFVGISLGTGLIIANAVGAVTHIETILISIVIVIDLGIAYTMNTISKSS